MSEKYQEHTVAIYIGVTGRMDQDEVLVEIIRHGEAPGAWSYRAYDIGGDIKRLETKTIGFLQEPDLGEHQPPRFILSQFDNHWWRRVR